MSRKNTLWLGTNLKMFKTPRQTEEYLRALREVYRSLPWREELSLFVIPSYTALPDAVSAAGDDIMIGAQNMHWEEQGEFTGEISPLMLEEIGVRLVMTAHSERRRKFGETDETANKKVLSSVRHGFVSLLCVGEDAEQKASGTGLAVMRRQLEVGLSGLSDCGNIWIAYEPAWAIGASGTPARPEYVAQVHSFLRDVLLDMFGPAGQAVPILYGGSTNASNAEGLISANEVDGLFIGRAAWTVDSFENIMRLVRPVWRNKQGFNA